jgi:hypothetical protein
MGHTMKPSVSIVCDKTRTDDLLLWFESPKKWKVTVTNHADHTVYLSWAESFTNPFNNQLWVAKIDESSTAGDRFIVEAQNLECTNFITSGSEEHHMAPDRFIQIGIQPNQTASWIMERIKSSHWEGFNVYDQSLVHQIQTLKQIPTPVENIFPKIKGWPWA